MTKLKNKLLPMSIAIAVMALIGAGPASADECVRPKGPDILATTIVYFDIDSTKIPQDAEAKLKEIAGRFKGHPSLAVCSLGQADRSGAADYNQKLAMRRAAAVADASSSRDGPRRCDRAGVARVTGSRDVFGSGRSRPARIHRNSGIGVSVRSRPVDKPRSPSLPVPGPSRLMHPETALLDSGAIFRPPGTCPRLKDPRIRAACWAQGRA